MPAELNLLRDRLKRVLPLASVYVTGYPDLLEGRQGPDLLAGIMPDEARWAATNVVDRLNSNLKAGRGWKYVDVGPRFRGHDAASGDARCVNGLTDSLIGQGPIPKFCSIGTIPLLASAIDPKNLGPCVAGIVLALISKSDLVPKGTLHPNAAGQQAIADALLERIRLEAYGS